MWDVKKFCEGGEAVVFARNDNVTESEFSFCVAVVMMNKSPPIKIQIVGEDSSQATEREYKYYCSFIIVIIASHTTPLKYKVIPNKRSTNIRTIISHAIRRRKVFGGGRIIQTN